MSPTLVALVSLACLVLGYRYYARFLADSVFGLKPDEPMPSVEQADGVDFVPTRREVLWGHHFSSIAGVAPILGPAMAIVWGWLPAMIWVVVGVVFMGAAHDFGALVLSIRHGGRSVGDLAETFISPRSKVLFLIVIFFLIWLVGAVFAFAIAGLFVSQPASILPVNLEILVALGIGWWAFKAKRSVALPSVIALIGLYLVIFGTASGALWVPAEGSLFLSIHFWLVALMVYAFVASCLPVWLLLQPRDLINSHQLLVGLGALYLGFFFTRPEFAAPMVGELEELPSLFPLLMVTIACGAISGFHGLVSSGTTSKQLASAADAKAVGYGSMLCETALAILATMAVAAGMGGEKEVWYGLHAVSAEGGGTLPPVSEALGAFVQGASSFLTVLGIAPALGATIVAVLVISFAATSLDTSLRIQRLVLAELGRTYRVRALENRWIGGAIACSTVLILVYADFDAGAKSLWPVFGATNQVLAALTLLICALYLRTIGRRTWPYLIPAIFVMAITFTAMSIQVFGDVQAGNWMVAAVGSVIAILTLWVAFEGTLAWRRRA